MFHIVERGSHFDSFNKIRYWGGGSIDAAAADAPFCVKRSLGPLGSADSPHELFEDGTVHFLGISGLRAPT